MENRGVLFFDAACGLCSASVNRLQLVLRRRGFTFIPIQDPSARTVLSMRPGEVADELKMQLPDGRLLGGLDVFAYFSKYVWWAFPFHLLMLVPPARQIALHVYKWVARNRYHISGTCGLRPLLKN